jgi:hypothetical protein
MRRSCWEHGFTAGSTVIVFLPKESSGICDLEVKPRVGPENGRENPEVPIWISHVLFEPIEQKWPKVTDRPIDRHWCVLIKSSEKILIVRGSNPFPV